MKDIEEVNELKLRLSAGVTGTQNIGNYNNKDLYGPNDFLGKPGIIPTTLGNNDLRWERTKQFDIAVDYALLDYRLSGSIGWYYKNTNDLLWYIDFPTSLQPFSGMYKNVGRVQNKGFEWIVDAKIFRETEVKWDVTFNLAVNRNKVKSWYPKGHRIGPVKVWYREAVPKYWPKDIRWELFWGTRPTVYSSPGHRSRNIIKRHRSS